MDDPQTYELFKAAILDGVSIIKHLVVRHQQREIDDFAPLYVSGQDLIVNGTSKTKSFRIAEVFDSTRYQSISSWPSFFQSYNGQLSDFKGVDNRKLLAEFIETSAYSFGLDGFSEKNLKKLFDQWNESLPKRQKSLQYIFPLFGFGFSQEEIVLDKGVLIKKNDDPVDFYLRELRIHKNQCSHFLSLETKGESSFNFEILRNKVQVALSVSLGQSIGLPLIFGKPLNYSIGWAGPYKKCSKAEFSPIEKGMRKIEVSKSQTETLKSVLLFLLNSRDQKIYNTLNLLYRIVNRSDFIEKVYLLRDAFTVLLTNDQETEITFYKIKVRCILLSQHLGVDNALLNPISTLDSLFLNREIFRSNEIGQVVAESFKLLSLCIQTISRENLLTNSIEVDRLMMK